jgi:hypothetical protein
MRSDSVLAFIVIMTLAVGGIGVLLPLGRALARRIERPRGDSDDLVGRVAELEQRLADADMDRQRIAELEERLDFAERLLAVGNAAPPKELP